MSPSRKVPDTDAGTTTDTTGDTTGDTTTTVVEDPYAVVKGSKQDGTGSKQDPKAIAAAVHCILTAVPEEDYGTGTYWTFPALRYVGLHASAGSVANRFRIAVDAAARRNGWDPGHNAEGTPWVVSSWTGDRSADGTFTPYGVQVQAKFPANWTADVIAAKRAENLAAADTTPPDTTGDTGSDTTGDTDPS